MVAPRAQTDIDDIVGYVAADSPKAALHVFEKLLASVHSLSRMPERAPAAPEDQDCELGIRQLLSGNYRILFQLDEPERRVSVLRVIHGARAYLEREDLGRAE